MVIYVTALQIGFYAVGIGLATHVCAANIYFSEGQDGNARYSTQPLDKSYKVYLSEKSINLFSRHSSQNIKRQSLSLETKALIERTAQEHEIDPALVYAIITVESQFNSRAKSSKGASGLMQLMPATASQYGATNVFDPLQNIEAGVRYLKDLLVLHKGNIALALASYNAGQGTTIKHKGRIPPFKETMLFVPAVLAELEALRAQKH